MGDFLAVVKIATDAYDACKDGPGECQEIWREARSLQFSLEELSQNADDPSSLLNRKGVRRKTPLLELISNCEETMKEIQTLVTKHIKLLDEGHGVR